MRYLIVFVLVDIAFGIDPTVTIANTSPATRIDAFNEKEIVVVKNGTVSMTCVVENKGLYRMVTWIRYKDNGPILSISSDEDVYDPRKYRIYHTSPTSWQLRIMNVQVSDEMRYACRVQLGVSRFVQDVTRIRVAAFGIDPTVTIENTSPATRIDAFNEKEIVAVKNGTVSMTCVVENKGLYRKVTWLGYKDKGPILPISSDEDVIDSRKYRIYHTSPTSWQLRIMNVQVSDEMRYACRVQLSISRFVQDVTRIRVTDPTAPLPDLQGRY